MADSETKKVLVVDDEETLTWSMTKTLSKDRATYQLLTANSGTEALRIIEKHSLNVVITDIKMPDISGLDLLSTIKDKYPWIKVIIMTAYGSPEVQKEASERGSFQYIEKPFEIDDIRTLIFQALEEKQERFVGQVLDLQLVDIIQIGCLGRLTMSIDITRGEEKGLICIKNGDIVHAQVGSAQGEEALFTLLGWKGGRFVSQMGTTPPKQTIDARWEQLLMEGMKRTDDAALERQESSSGLMEEIEGAFEDLGKEIQVKDTLGDILGALRVVRGYRGGAWINEQGKVVESDRVEMSEQNAVIPLASHVLASRLAKILGTDTVERITLGQKRHQSVIVGHDNLLLWISLTERITGDEFYSAARKVLEKKITTTHST